MLCVAARERRCEMHSGSLCFLRYGLTHSSSFFHHVQRQLSCYVMLYMLCYVTLCYVMFCYDVLCYVML